jgi:transcriptional regulator with XRE-family HTH domain
MFSVSDFLDRAKAGAGITSDYALAKLLGLSHSRVSNWRNDHNAPDERAVVKLCKLSGDDPEHVAACIQSMRAANDDAADLWRRVAVRLQKGAANVIFAWAIATLLLAMFAEPVQAAAALLAAPVAGVCILC